MLENSSSAFNETPSTNAGISQVENQLHDITTDGLQQHPGIRGWSDLLSFPLTTNEGSERSLSVHESTSTLVSGEKDRLELLHQKILLGQSSPGSFVKEVGNIDWNEQLPSVFEKAIRIAISLECIAIARQLIKQGRRQYPKNNALRALGDVLEPPKIIERGGPTEGLSAFMKWFEQHAEEYRGLWVAVLEGDFLGAAPSKEALINQLDDTSADPDIIISLLP